MVVVNTRFHLMRSCKPWLSFATNTIPKTDHFDGVEHSSISLNQQNPIEVECLEIGVANPNGEAWLHEYAITSSSYKINYVCSFSYINVVQVLLAPAHPLQSTIITSITRRLDLCTKVVSRGSNNDNNRDDIEPSCTYQIEYRLD